MEFRTNSVNPERLSVFLADRGFIATVEDRVAEGLFVLTDDPTVEVALAEYTDEYVPQVVRDALQFLKQRADAGDNSAKAVLVLFRYVHRRLSAP